MTTDRRGAAAGEGSSGYLLSAVAFAALTALWAVVVRDDPFYRFIDVAGVPAPVMTLAYVFLAPLIGFLLGCWRYEPRHEGGAFSFAGKLIARVVHFTYAHALIALFTLAMAMDYFIGFNIDDQVKSLNDRSFDIAARFAPWLCAYLAGFNLGRAQRQWRGRAHGVSNTTASAAGFAGEERSRTGKRAPKERAEPVLGESPFQPTEADARGDLGDTPSPAPPAAHEEPGFLPPQDFSKLRPGLNHLR